MAASSEKKQARQARYRKSHRKERTAYMRRWRKENVVVSQAAYRRQKAARYARRKQWLAKQKNKPCADCHRKYPPYVMQFHHVRGKKKFSVSSRLFGRPLNQLKREIKKCILLCANCHAEREWG